VRAARRAEWAQHRAGQGQKAAEGVSASGASEPTASSAPEPSFQPPRVVFQLPNIGSWFENIAVTSGGTILATRVDAPEIWAINPATGKGEKWAEFSAPITSVCGIAELKDGLFVIGVGQWDMTKNAAVPGR
jgi:hypothetical protein